VVLVAGFSFVNQPGSAGTTGVQRTMLQSFNNQADVPEALREHYSKREDGKWHVDIPDEHPAVKHNAKLLSEKQGAETKVTQLTSDLESARAGNLGRGQVATTKADMALLDEFKALGTLDEVKVKVTEHGTLKEADTKRAREDKLRLVAKELQYDNVDAFIRLPNLPDFDIRTDKDGKKVVALVKDGDKFIEKPATEYLESSPDHSPFLAALKTQPAGVTVNGTSSSSTTTKPGEPFAWAKSYADSYIKNAKPTTDWTTAFGAGKPTV
jgi:hypothetical protein